jgi:alginate O-acetyltransferase complex protein AlgI
MRKYKFIGRIVTFIIVVLSFVIFNHTSINEILAYYANMFGMNGIKFVNAESLYYFRSYFILLFISILAMGPFFKNVYVAFANKYPSLISSLELVGVAFVLVMTTAFLLDASFNPFLYFRF